MSPHEISRFVADRLKALRTERCLSLRKLAQRSDLTPEMLSRAERAERTPSLETLARACQGLGVTLAEFFDGGRISRAPARAATPAEHFSKAIREIERGLEVLKNKRQPNPPKKHGNIPL